MTTPQLLQQAKQGDPAAIAQLMNQSLVPKGIEATVFRQGDRLRVQLASANPINQSVLAQFVQNGIQNLNIPGVKVVELVGQPQSSPSQGWSQVLSLVPSVSPVAPPLPPTPPPSTVAVPSGASAPQPSTIDDQPPSISGITPDTNDDWNLSAAVLENDLSLDDELSMATIDQIVADAVKEVTTKIQNEMPFDPEDATVAHMGTQTPGNVAVSRRREAVNPLDSALEQAIQTGQLEDFLSQDLDLSDSMDDFDLESLDELDRIDGVTQMEPFDLEQPSEASLGFASPTSAMTSSEFSSLTEPEPSAFSPSSLELDMDHETASVNHDNKAADDSAEAGNIDPDGLPRKATSDEKSASRILLAIVSALTFGTIAGLLGYSIRSYDGPWYEVFASPSDQASSGAADDTATDDTNGNEAATDSTTAADSTDSATSDEDAVTPDAVEEEFPTTPSEDGSEAPSEDDPTASSEDGAAVEDDAATTAPADADATGSDTVAVNPALQPPDPAIANCPAIATSPTQTLTLSQIQLDPENPPDNGIYTITGCLTNHTNAPIVAATLDYEGRSPAGTPGQGSMYFVPPAPKSTVPFRTRVLVSNGASGIQVLGIIWNPEGAEAQTLPLEFSLPIAAN